MALSFRDSEALQVVVRAGLCPPDVLARGATVGTAADGALVLAPDAAVSATTLAKLAAVGVTVTAALPPGARPVRCWAEAIAPVRVAVPELPALVLFVCERAEQLLDLAGELVRLGCDRVELLGDGTRGVARVVDPPTYTVVRALDREGGLRVFSPDPAGQERVWTEVGYRHPLAGAAVPSDQAVRAPDDAMLLIAGDGAAWTTLPAIGWRGLDAALELAVPGTPVAHVASPLLARRRVELRLSGGRREPASLWVVREHGLAALDQLLRYLPDDVVARLTFAASGGADPTIIVRARTGRTAAPELAFAVAETYAPLAQMPDVYAPAGAIVEPPLRRERLRQILGVAPGEVMWLARTTEAGAFRAERIADAAFAPLSEWAEYVIHASAPALVPWMRATELDFAPYISTGLEWASSPSATPADNPRARPRSARAHEVVDERGGVPPPRAAAAAPARVTERGPRATEAAAAHVPVDEELAAIETEFVALDAPADAPGRIGLLARLGAAYARLGRRRDAGLCFARAAWEATAADAPARLDAWIAADLHGAAADGALARILAAAAPSSDDVRLVAAIVARATPAVTRDPHRVQRWLDDHDQELDARSLWLARSSLARLAGGDVLALAHARDRILARLAGGLPVERELPAFLRYAGRRGALGTASGEHLRDALDELAARLAKTKRKRGPIEAPLELTMGYVGFIFAHGFARIGNPDRARAGIEASTAALADVRSDPVHAYLIAAYTARIEQAVAGDPPETPMPDAVVAQLEALDNTTLDRYKADRLRESSWILEPVQRQDAILAFTRKHDSRGAEFSALRALPEVAARGKALDALVTAAAAADSTATVAEKDADRERLLSGVFEHLLELPEAIATPILVRAWPQIHALPEPRRALLYTGALVAAAHFGRAELVPELLRGLAGAIRLAVGLDLERVVQRSVRTLRRIGLRAELGELLANAQASLVAKDAQALRGRLALATGMAFLGDVERALPIFEEARAAIQKAPQTRILERLDLLRAVALAYTQTPVATALACIADLSTQWKDITDGLGTSSHYCISVLHFVESLVLGITSDDLALGEAGRRFVEDDEHLIRRRLHRDLKGQAT